MRITCSVRYYKDPAFVWCDYNVRIVKLVQNELTLPLKHTTVIWRCLMIVVLCSKKSFLSDYRATSSTMNEVQMLLDPSSLCEVHLYGHTL